MSIPDPPIQMGTILLDGQGRQWQCRFVSGSLSISEATRILTNRIGVPEVVPAHFVAASSKPGDLVNIPYPRADLHNSFTGNCQLVRIS